jgi:hypothetical protein
MNKKIYSFLVACFIGISGCNDFLEEEVRGIINPSTFYTSDTEAILAVNGIYSNLRQNGFYGNWQGIHNFTQIGADELESSRVFGGNEQIQAYTMTASNYANARELWLLIYRLIGDANSVIYNVQDNPQISQSVRNQVVGEALFLRSFAYYHLTNLWGDVPYYEEELPIAEVASLGRMDETEIRNNLIRDLKRIEDENLLPSVYSGTDLGRPTIWATKMLMAKLYLWQEQWENALNKSVEIINESPHFLLEDYGDVFDINNPFNNEVIWAIDFLKDVPGNAQDRTDAFNPRLRDEPKNSSDRNGLSELLTSRNEEFNGYGLTVPILSFIEEFPENDLRRPHNIMTHYGDFELNYQYMPKFMSLNFVESPRGNHGEATLVFRLADVYLMAAEAENELNGPNNALQYINAVRSRAFEPDQPYVGMDYETLKKAIQDERRWELAGEGHRRYDLIRWGILLEAVKNAEYRTYDPASNIQPHHVKLPIPEEEIILNPVLLEADPTNNGYNNQ